LIILIHGSLFPLFDLLHEDLVVTHFGHHVFSFLPRIHKNINSLVQLIQVQFHVFLLTFEVFRLFITVELVKSRSSIVGTIRLAAFGRVVLALSVLLGEFLLPLVRVGISLLHESESSLF
jgi:hypothetical protein